MEHWYLWLIAAILWFEGSRRFLAAVETSMGRPLPLAAILYVSLFWPVTLLVLMVITLYRLPRTSRSTDDSQP